VGILKYLLILILFTTTVIAHEDKDVYLYTELYGPQESLWSPNLEITLHRTESKEYGDGSLRLRAAVRFSGLVIFTMYPSYLGGLHYIVGREHKMDLGINILYQELTEYFVLQSGTSVSFNLGYRHRLGKNWFVGFAFNPTYGRENKPFYPVSLKIGASIF
jgi:hypothetical protein